MLIPQLLAWGAERVFMTAWELASGLVIGLLSASLKSVAKIGNLTENQLVALQTPGSGAPRHQQITDPSSG
jgi:hypothetical protein